MLKFIVYNLNKLKKIKFIPSTIWAATILYLSLGRIHTPKDLELFPHIDKVVHFSMYFILSTLLLFELNESKKKNIIALIMFYTISFGLLMEFLQALIFTYRTGDYVDFISNTIGSVCALIFFKYGQKSIKI